MPQFDFFSFFHQVFWFLLFFLTFYFFISYFFLPKLNSNLKFRQKKKIFHFQNHNTFFFEKSFQNQTLSQMFNFFFSFFSTSFSQKKEICIQKKKQNQTNAFAPILFLKKLNVFFHSYFLFLK